MNYKAVVAATVLGALVGALGGVLAFYNGWLG